jgi:hypothetical protein
MHVVNTFRWLRVNGVNTASRKPTTAGNMEALNLRDEQARAWAPQGPNAPATHTN